MEENVALDSSKQKQFVKSIKGIKKLIKQNDSSNVKFKDSKIRKKTRKERGLVYLSHIPHGFYENEMTQYFKQFGVVTNARVIRSKRTGNSKGFAFVEFKEPSVAQIVAETMNNYLMGKRLIKASYIPPEKIKPKAMRKHWNATNNPGTLQRIKMKKAYNADKDDKGELDRARKLLSNLTKTKKKLSELGINYDFFTPVDVPEELLDKIIKKETDDSKESIKEELNGKSKKKNKKKPKSAVNDCKETIQEPSNEGKKKKEEGGKSDIKAVTLKQKKSDKGGKDKSRETTVKSELAKSKQNEKKCDLKQKEKKISQKTSEDFIKTNSDDDDEDSSYIFDSDEYEKAIEKEDEYNSNISSGDDESVDAIDIGSIEDLPNIKKKGKATQPLQPVKVKKGNREKLLSLPQQKKRKVSGYITAVTPKKPKFEKQDKQKQFKKKK